MRLRYRLRLAWLVVKCRVTSMRICGARQEWVGLLDDFTEIKIVLRDTAELDTYSREEVYRMLRTVRREEARTGWKCPEPDMAELVPTICIRMDGHDGPCNGFPRETCPGYRHAGR